MNTMKLAGAGVVGLLALALASTPATAPPITGPPIVVEPESDLPRAFIPYGDLNLASASGRETRHARVRGAARGLCPNEGVDPLKPARLQQRDRGRAGADSRRDRRLRHDPLRRARAY